MRFWRLSRFPAAARTFDGEGARRYPGRWNAAGVPVVYASASLSLAALEILVHADLHHLKLRHFAFSIEVPEAQVERVPEAKLPPDWNVLARPARAQEFGSAWARSRRSIALLVPSIVIPGEPNAVLNPLHPAFAGLVIAGPEPFDFDPRVVKAPARARGRGGRR